MGRRKKMVEHVTELMDKPEFIRNIGTVAHIDHGKTTFSDNLLAGAGMISSELAGEQLFMDFDEEEQRRGITIDSATVSMVHQFEGQEYLINLIDTPGHVDFG
ncbi:MAG: GTP-binding protein, partial [Candidatus Methanoperedens sp.]|nr:GTP-binding protein [Candidatus Methanoperedens sp.]